jgi:succinate dehydrogenase / fumarate reductase cytochrome b subunit
MSRAEESMNWIASTLGASVGKKLMMAVTGLVFCGFLIGHLAGNLFIYGGADAFNAYAEHLHALGPLVTLAESVLLFCLVVHVGTGLVLFFQNQKARPESYAVNKRAGGRTIGSATMPYTGVIILAFVVFHLLNFHFVDKTVTPIYTLVAQAFVKPAYIVIYILAMIVVAVHVSHGLWSAFQTLGANHPKYMPFVTKLSIALSLVFGFGFGLIPVFVSLTA